MPTYKYDNEHDARIAWGRVLDIGEKQENRVVVMEKDKEIEKKEVVVTFKNNIIKYLV